MRVFILLCGGLVLMAASRLVGSAAADGPPPPPGVEAAMEYFRGEAKGFAGSCSELRKAIEAGKDVGAVRGRLAEARLRYKHIESFLEYFFRSSATIYNRAPKFEAEEGSMEYQSPIGLQLMESLLYEPRIDRKSLLEQAKAVESSASDLPALLYGLKADDRQLLESLRVELIRVMALDITGYEAPLLKTGIGESVAAMEAVELQLRPYLDAGARADRVQGCLGRVREMLGGGGLKGGTVARGFDGFDRLRFLKEAMLPLQRQLGLLIREKGLELNTSKTLNYSAAGLFSPEALAGFVGRGGSPELIAQGRRLFFDSSLSGNGRKSCASCHNPAKAFTDGLRVSVGLDGHQLLDRNAPTLLYAGYQYSQFWDGRVKSLEEQIRTVLKDKREMGADTVREEDVAAIAAFVRSLHPMNSAFDRYIRGEAGLPLRERRGANLFMGKAQCATCHFMPLFNGLIPPDYAVTEFEVLGTTVGDGYLEARGGGDRGLRLSPDSGRYRQYPFPFFRGAFKTPTVRNAAVTSPYMHNGGFHSLETVLQFYNKGGGAGMGLKVPDQTLSSLPLRLSVEEMNDIILFLHALTDTL